jgi:peptidase E
VEEGRAILYVGGGETKEVFWVMSFEHLLSWYVFAAV